MNDRLQAAAIIMATLIRNDRHSGLPGYREEKARRLAEETVKLLTELEKQLEPEKARESAGAPLIP